MDCGNTMKGNELQSQEISTTAGGCASGFHGAEKTVSCVTPEEAKMANSISGNNSHKNTR